MPDSWRWSRRPGAAGALGLLLLGLIAPASFAAPQDATPSTATPGSVWAWGANGYGQLGIGNNNGPQDCGSGFIALACSTTPVQAQNLTGVTKLATGGGSFSLTLRSDGTVWAWGGNTSGELGD